MGLRPLVIKLGGAALSSPDTLERFFDAVSEYRAFAKRQLVIVHGGGYLIDEILTAHGQTSEIKQGLRVTPKQHINLVVGALAGTANKLLQAKARSCGIQSVGLSLADGGLCSITPLSAELGFVGKATPKDPTLLHAVLATDSLPIISSIGITNEGELMNVNADQAAVAVAGVLDAELVLLSDVSGVLDGKGVLLPALNEIKAVTLIESGVIRGGMIVKVNAAFDAARLLGRSIEVASWRYPEKLFMLFGGSNIGTRFSV